MQRATIIASFFARRVCYSELPDQRLTHQSHVAHTAGDPIPDIASLMQFALQGYTAIASLSPQAICSFFGWMGRHLTLAVVARYQHVRGASAGPAPMQECSNCERCALAEFRTAVCLTTGSQSDVVSVTGEPPPPKRPRPTFCYYVLRDHPHRLCKLQINMPCGHSTLCNECNENHRQHRGPICPVCNAKSEIFTGAAAPLSIAQSAFRVLCRLETSSCSSHAATTFAWGARCDLDHESRAPRV